MKQWFYQFFDGVGLSLPFAQVNKSWFVIEDQAFVLTGSMNGWAVYTTPDQNHVGNRFVHVVKIDQVPDTHNLVRITPDLVPLSRARP